MGTTKKKAPAKSRRRATGTNIPPVPIDEDHPHREYTIDELALAGGSTVRNVRAYQDRGLLAPPQRRGRSGWYSSDHLARLRLIGNLLSRGYTLGNIGELIEGLERGHKLSQIVGLERAISSPWSDEQPRHYTMTELIKMFGPILKPRTLAKVIEMGLLEPDGLRFRAASPKVLIAGAELAKAGMPLPDLLEVMHGLRANVQHVADEMVQLVAHMLDKYGEGELPPAKDVPKLADIIWRLRPLAMMAVEAEVSRALEKAANKYLGERVAQILDHQMEERDDQPARSRKNRG